MSPTGCQIIERERLRKPELTHAIYGDKDYLDRGHWQIWACGRMIL